MSRTTRKEVESKFAWLLEVIGGKQGESWNEVGSYRLDHNSTYGGYVIERVINEHGGVSRPFGDSRRGASDMWYAMDFAIDVLRVYQKAQDANAESEAN